MLTGILLLNMLTSHSLKRTLATPTQKVGLLHKLSDFRFFTRTLMQGPGLYNQRRGLFMIRKRFAEMRLPRAGDLRLRNPEQGVFLGMTPHRQIYVKLINARSEKEQNYVRATDYEAFYRDVIETCH